MDRPEIVAIDWLDALSTHGWEAPEDTQEPALCHTVGFVVKETEAYIVLAATWGIGRDGATGAESNNRIAVPKGWIKNRETVALRSESASQH